MLKRLKLCLLVLIILLPLSINFSSPGLLAAEDEEKITILFTHDLHDHLLPVKDKRNGEIFNSGGYARLQTAILREKAKNPNVVLVDAGDFSMGTPFQTVFASDAPQLRIMGAMGYDAITFGNHEYDYRPLGLAASLKAAKESGDRLPDIVQANVIFPVDQEGNLTPSLQELQNAYAEYGVKEYTIIERSGVRIGIFGLMGKDAAAKAPMAEVEFAEPVESAKRIVKILREEEKVDLIICLSHSGTADNPADSEDELLAREVPEINVIISGHTHTKLAEPILIGRTIIGSTQDSCRYLGVINISRAKPSAQGQDGGNPAAGSNGGWQLDSYRLETIDGRLESDPQIDSLISAYQELVQEKYFDNFQLKFDQVLAVAPFNFLTQAEIRDKHEEDPLGNLISDAYIYAVQQAEGDAYEPVAVAIVPVGTIRESFYQGEITTADAFNVCSLGIGPDRIPGYPLISVYLTGEELKTVCEVDASVSPLMKDAQLFLSGLNFTFNPNRLIFNKVTDAYLVKPDGSREEIVDNQLYRVIANLYSAQMLSIVGDKSFGLLSIVPKTKDGTPITDFEAQIVRDLRSGTRQEVKEWQALAEYLQSFSKTNGVSQIPEYYSRTQGRKVVDNDTSLSALLQNPNKIALGVYGAGSGLIALLIFGTVKINARLKRRRKASQSAGR
ncbi:MAG TPA: bifunctional metallophosphatase/5'-nucleotidase [Peptococcaceae bacterium]|nr:bifunctional metallophosphatase/5'-nucleotidase [Peptococcaceae bacterium]